MPYPQNLIVFGDSISYGSWDVQGGWVDRLKKPREELRREDGSYYLTYNLGIPGETVRGLYDRFLSETRIRVSQVKTSNCLIFAYGMNDLIPSKLGGKAVEPDEFKSMYEQVLLQAACMASKIYVLGITPIIESADRKSILGRSNLIIQHYNQIIRDISNEADCRFVELYNKFKDNNLNSLIDTDGLHPNDAGHELIFKEFDKLFVSNL